LDILTLKTEAPSAFETSITIHHYVANFNYRVPNNSLSQDPAHNFPSSVLFFKMHLNVITQFNAQFIYPV